MSRVIHVEIHAEDVAVLTMGSEDYHPTHERVKAAGGQVGAAPALPGQEISITVNASSRLTSVKEFEQIRLRVENDGSVLRLTTLQRAGGKRLAAGEFLRGHAMAAGDPLGAMSESQAP